MAKEKVLNYTPEMTAEIIAAYIGGEAVEQIAVRIGKSTRSIVAKLSREGCYKPKTYTSKMGEAAVKKDMVADQLGRIVGLTETEIESLTKASKTALIKILHVLKAHTFFDGIKSIPANNTV